MDSPQKYEPPESVVGPAFSELLERLARSRVRNLGDMEMSDEERKIFDYGVSERKRVLEHTLLLAFGQWAVYKQVITRLKLRPLRLAYVTATVLATAKFVSARARRVSHEMFATIATTPTTSSLGNEARVVLAELEGPDGPYFRAICKEKGFAEDLPSVIATLDAQDDVDPATDHVHPQLRLRPRLPVRPAIESRVRRELPGAGETRGGRDSSRLKALRRDVGEDQQPLTKDDFRPAPVQRERAWFEMDHAAVRTGEKTKGERPSIVVRRAGMGKEVGVEQAEELWGKPFNFAAAAGSAERGSEDLAEEEDKAGGIAMTASQRRAKERRDARMRKRGLSATQQATDESEGGW